MRGDYFVIYIYIYISHQPSGLRKWSRGTSGKITPLLTLSPGLRSGPLGSVAGEHRFLQTIQKTMRKPPKTVRCYIRPSCFPLFSYCHQRILEYVLIGWLLCITKYAVAPRLAAADAAPTAANIHVMRAYTEQIVQLPTHPPLHNWQAI